MDLIKKEALTMHPNFFENLRTILDSADSNVTSTDFSTYRGNGFILENNTLWLGYLLGEDKSESVELTFHLLPPVLIEKLRYASSLKVRVYTDNDLLARLPFSVNLIGNLENDILNCNRLEVHHGDIKGSRIDHSDFCCVGRTIQGFKKEALQGGYGPVNSAVNWFCNGDELLNSAFNKYGLLHRIRIFNSRLIN